jgi:hypothetical protein
MYNNFVGLNDDNEAYSDIDEVIDDSAPDTSMFDVSDVLARFEQAKLYSTLINHKLFSPGSADPAIVEFVEREIKQFVVTRMRVLMGVQADVAQPVMVQSPFDDTEVAALKSIASRLIEKQRPELNQPVVQEPKINTVLHSQPQTQILPQPQPVMVNRPQLSQPTKPIPQPTKPAPAKKGKGNKKIEIRAPTPEEGNVGSDGTTYSQAVPSNSGRLPMPSQEMMNAMAVEEAIKNQNYYATGAKGGKDALVGLALSFTQGKLT